MVAGGDGPPLDFAITDAGVLSFAAIPDYEDPADSGGNNVYNVTVKALDSDGEIGGPLPVTVTVRDVNEVPAITGNAAIDYRRRTARAGWAGTGHRTPRARTSPGCR